MIKIISEKSFINEEKRTCVVVLVDEFKKEYKGKAVCSPEDFFDKTIGIKIAYLRAKKQVVQNYRNFLKKNIEANRKQYESYFTNVNKELEKCNHILENSNKTMSNLLG